MSWHKDASVYNSAVYSLQSPRRKKRGTRRRNCQEVRAPRAPVCVPRGGRRMFKNKPPHGPDRTARRLIVLLCWACLTGCKRVPHCSSGSFDAWIYASRANRVRAWYCAEESETGVGRRAAWFVGIGKDGRSAGCEARFRFLPCFCCPSEYA